MKSQKAGTNKIKKGGFMTEIMKYHGKSRKTGEWVTGVPIRHGDEIMIFPAQMDESETIYDLWQRIEYCLPETIGQFTGKLDKSKAELYDGDIIKLEFSRNGKKEKATFLIGWEKRIGAFMLYGEKNSVPFPDDGERQEGIERIGNIHDNPAMVSLNVREEYCDRKGIITYAARTGGIQAEPQNTADRNGSKIGRRSANGGKARAGV